MLVVIAQICGEGRSASEAGATALASALSGLAGLGREADAYIKGTVRPVLWIIRLLVPYVAFLGIQTAQPRTKLT